MLPGWRVIDQTLPLHVSIRLKPVPACGAVLVGAHSNAADGVDAVHSLQFSEPSRLGLGLGVIDHVLPFQLSTSVWHIGVLGFVLPASPTATHWLGLVQDIPLR